MGSVILPHLHSAWHVDQSILSEDDRLVIIRFGKDGHPDCLRQDDVLAKIAEKVKNFAVIYLCDIDEVPDFNSMYELYDPMTIMVCAATRMFAQRVWLVADRCFLQFFFRNKHMMCMSQRLVIVDSQLTSSR